MQKARGDGEKIVYINLKRRDMGKDEESRVVGRGTTSLPRRWSARLLGIGDEEMDLFFPPILPIRRGEEKICPFRLFYSSIHLLLLSLLTPGKFNPHPFHQGVARLPRVSLEPRRPPLFSFPRRRRVLSMQPASPDRRTEKGEIL